MPAPAAPLAPLRPPALTEDAWQRVCPLLLPLRRPRGRPYADHRRIGAGMPWVERTGCSWQTLPQRFGPWQSVYHRYQRWRASGLWARLLDLLNPDEAAAPE